MPTSNAVNDESKKPDACTAVVSQRRTLLLWSAACVAAQGLSACSGIKVIPPPPPPPPKPTIVNLELKAQDNLNPDTRGRPSPLLVRVYELATPAGFEALGFETLHADDTAGLKPDLVDKREQVIAPGAALSITIKPADSVKFIGVFASYRDLTRAQWRAVVPVKSNLTQRIDLRFDDRAVTAQATVTP